MAKRNHANERLRGMRYEENDIQYILQNLNELVTRQKETMSTSEVHNEIIKLLEDLLACTDPVVESIEKLSDEQTRHVLSRLARFHPASVQGEISYEVKLASRQKSHLWSKVVIVFVFVLKARLIEASKNLLDHLVKRLGYSNLNEIFFLGKTTQLLGEHVSSTFSVQLQEQSQSIKVEQQLTRWRDKETNKLTQKKIKPLKIMGMDTIVDVDHDSQFLMLHKLFYQKFVILFNYEHNVTN
ncbi:hypothetical protein RFI_05066 [Reticulomyxa filosa]|uniref:Uncharacterized protein n=1 Tax=Reticulomyxa filosa TaxID=46433 RepID=X6P1N0_RETFI|nr:hypothetical protein RFI_05066 [Reticulomyxa filosa]|eukprot:ETO32048.1 hypothetical protein RFI_05066 [Reticulomyxa filosa]